MSAWKQFLSSDIIVNPFVVNKSFSFPYTSFYTESNGDFVGIDRFLGVNSPWSTTYSSNQTTGENQVEYEALIYRNIRQLYYSNFISSSTGDPVNQRVLIPGFNTAGDAYIGPRTNPAYDNFLQSTLTPNRFFPTASGAEIAVISIPSKIYGEYILPNSFTLEYPSLNSTITDDGQGNLNISGSTVGEGYIGNIIYTHGIAILTDVTLPDAGGLNLNDYVDDTDVTCSFTSSMTIWETQYKCTLRESEFNYTLNPSAQVSGSFYNFSGSLYYQPFDGTPANNVTGSYFAPYVTTVGLYDEMQNLLAVGKLSQPLPTSATTDTTILVNLDF
jgi:hypothetical protein